MVIYGVSLLSICMLVGVFVGDLLGKLVGVKANVGGVGIAMLLLVLIVDYLTKKNKLDIKSQEGLSFWSSMYIPIVVAMASQQNVVAAVKGGPVALLAGVGATVVCAALVPVVSRIGQTKQGFMNEVEEA
ncbi:malonate transporter subunit MadL [Brevibacillus sp. B_LB10_24]|uniref:malonate transporter subunit MadL n=1 Tax=Brevibacillus sp. B_LB10_24 TaxID=3380645 RepID=UPI0038BB95A4